MPPKISVSDDEFDGYPEEEVLSDSEEVSEPELDDDEPEEDDSDEDDSVGVDYEDQTEPDRPRPLRGARPARETKKRQLTFYEEDEFSEEETPPAKRAPLKLKINRKLAALVTRTKRDEELFTEEDDYRPDMLKLTERQRAKLVEEETHEKYEDTTFAKMDEQLLSLNRKTAKKKETEEQLALRKAENARKRAHYKTKQLEEEKRDTLNKLLKRRATKTREKAVDDAQETKQTLKPRRPTMEHPALVRWVCTPERSFLGTN